MPIHAEPAGRRLTGRKVLLIFIGFFGVIVSADTFLIVSALRSWSGAETTSAYKAGQLYNEEIRLARLQAERGWRIVPTVERAADGAASIVVDVRDRSGEPLGGRAIEASLQRPTDKRGDRSVALVEETHGRYRGALAPIAPGQWALVLDVVEGGERAYRRKSRVVLR